METQVEENKGPVVRLVSQSKDGKKAMLVVVSHYGNGKKYSRTRHVKKMNGKWVGRE